MFVGGQGASQVFEEKERAENSIRRIRLKKETSGA